jgi:hypothetical protein
MAQAVQEFAAEYHLDHQELAIVALAAIGQTPSLAGSPKERRLIARARILKKKGHLASSIERRPGRKFMHPKPVRTRVAIRALELRVEGLSSEEIYEQLKLEKVADPLPAWRTVRRWIRFYEVESSQGLTRTLSKRVSEMRDFVDGELRPKNNAD